MFYKKSHRVI